MQVIEHQPTQPAPPPHGTAIVTLIDRLRSSIRETHSRNTENALRQLDEETEASLALLDVLDVLERLDSDVATQKNPISVKRKLKAQEDEKNTSRYQTLSYEQFIAGRRPHTQKSQLVHNSLAGSETSVVRGFLNRILGISADQHEEEENDIDDRTGFKSAFDLGDETDNPEAAIASGQEFDNKKPPSDPDTEAKKANRRKAAQRKATKDQILAAAAAFNKRITERRDHGALDNHDILRLRALLMILCTASWSGSKTDKISRRSPLWVLPVEGDQNTWPLMMGRLLFPMFGGRDPAIRHLYLRSEHDQIPGDIIECWATCFWCLQACLAAPMSSAGRKRIAQHLKPLLAMAYRLTLPTKAELLGDGVITLMDRMSVRYAKPLGVEPSTISDSHLSLVREQFREDAEHNHSIEKIT